MELTTLQREVCKKMIPAIMMASVTSASPESDLNFWLGNWEMDSHQPQPDGSVKFAKGAATNTIDRIQEGKVIHEKFKMPGFTGESWSVYNPNDKTWRQTWIDNSGAYLVLEGGKVGEEFILNQTYPAQPMRMRFTKITPTSFTWLWERKVESEWTLAWQLDYRRKS